MAGLLGDLPDVCKRLSEWYDDPPGGVDIAGRRFIRTGYMAYGGESWLVNAITSLGGVFGEKGQVYAVIVGAQDDPVWQYHGSGKLRWAISRRANGEDRPLILSEPYFMSQLALRDVIDPPIRPLRK